MHRNRVLRCGVCAAQMTFFVHIACLFGAANAVLSDVCSPDILEIVQANARSALTSALESGDLEAAWPPALA